MSHLNPQLTRQEHSKPQVGLIGVGVMGYGMAGSLLRNGYSVGVYNRRREKCASLKEKGAQVFDSPAAIAAASDLLVLMLSDDEAVQQVCTGPEGILAGGWEGLIVINSSTVLPETNQQLAAQFEDQGMTFLDAPVTGSRPQAEAGQLYFLVGGPEKVYQTAIPLFEAMGKGHIHLGPVGAGACAKLGNNLMGFINLCGIAEALQLTGRYGLDPAKFLEAVSNSGGRSAFSEAKGSKILHEDWSPDFALKLAAKDLRLAQAMAERFQQSAPVVRKAAEIFSQASEHNGDLDVCSLVKWYRESATPKAG